jgi:hypothetical protein
MMTIIDCWISFSIFHKSNNGEEDDTTTIIFLSKRSKNKKWAGEDGEKKNTLKKQNSTYKTSYKSKPWKGQDKKKQDMGVVLTFESCFQAP